MSRRGISPSSVCVAGKVRPLAGLRTKSPSPVYTRPNVAAARPSRRRPGTEGCMDGGRERPASLPPTRDDQQLLQPLKCPITEQS